jgi:hypothetical protein
LCAPGESSFGNLPQHGILSADVRYVDRARHEALLPDFVVDRVRLNPSGCSCGDFRLDSTYGFSHGAHVVSHGVGPLSARRAAEQVHFDLRYLRLVTDMTHHVAFKIVV